MIVCANCRKEMQCEHTGLGVRFGEAHVYPGDAYMCPDCSAYVVLANSEPVYDPSNHINTIQMEQE